MQHSQFVHLHNHSYYSLLDGAMPLDAMISKAKEYKMPALAITDHGNMFGAIEFYQKCLAAGIKPIIGCEMYITTSGSRKDRDPRRAGEGHYNHILLLCKNHKGYQNLCKLVSTAYIDGFYYKPRIDKDVLSECSEGLIASSACLKGEIPRAVMNGDIASARAACEWYLNVFGPERFFLEVMDVGLPEDARVKEGLKELSKSLGIGLVASNDCHYMRPEDASIQDALLCIQTGTTISEEKRLQFGSDKFYFRGPGEMERLFADMPEAVTNTLLVAEKCNLELDLKTYHFPKFALPEGEELAGYLEKRAWEGLEKRCGGQVVSAVPAVPSWGGDPRDAVAGGGSRPKAAGMTDIEHYKEVLKRELEMIKKMGFAGYFLIVADFINWAKENGIPVGPGRGSAAGSLTAYCLNITDVDPIPNKLFFERFLNPERISMPDMDIDFCMRRRPEVIEYVSKKYGYVSQIITFGKMKARAVVRDVGRVMGLPYGDVDKIAKLIPAAINMTLDEALRIEPQLKKLAKDDNKVARLLEIAKGLEGFPRHASTHAAGVVMSDQPLTNFLPLYVGQNDEVICQYDMKSVEKVGLVKFDFLGLKTLTVMHDAIATIKERGGTDIDLSRLKLDDKLVYEKLCEGETPGIFQLESSGMTDLVVKLKPNCFEDVVALVALFRPGPLGSGMVDDFINRKHGRTKIEYELPQLEPILKETYGVIVYQEQVMQIASALAGFTLGDADLLRRAMGKKKAEEMAEQRDRFLAGASKKKISAQRAEKIFDLMSEFAAYGFNKCVVAATRLFDADNGELFTVGDVFKSGRKRRVFSCGKGHKLLPRRIESVVSNGKKKVFALETHLSHKITATANHPFLTVLGWKNLGDLKKGDRIAVPRTMRWNGHHKMPDHEVITLAWLISEGNTCHPGSLYFYNNDKRLIDDFIFNVSKFKDTVARLYKRRDGRFEVCVNTGIRVRPPWNSRKKRIVRPPSFSGAFLWAKELGIIGKKAFEKSVPRSVFMLPPEKTALFLGRLWSGDGFIFGRNNTVPFYATSSETLAGDIRSLLIRHGIVSRVAKKRFKYRGGIKYGYAVFLTGEGACTRFISELGPHMIGRNSDIDKLKKYLEIRKGLFGSRDTIPWEIKHLVRRLKKESGLTWQEIEDGADISMKEFYGGRHALKRGFRRETILGLGRFFKAKDLLDIGDSDIYWDEIKDITPAGCQDTYDLTIAKDHNFVADGIIVHNSHSAAYAMIAYQTAYLKFHHPTEFMAALLTSEMGNTDKLIFYMNACRDMGIKVLPPDVNESSTFFSVVGDKEMRFGLAAVKNVGEAAVEVMIGARKDGGAFKSLDDFCERVDARKVNKRVMESLIKCGAFDWTNVHRAQLLSILDVAMSRAAGVQKDKAIGQGGLFDVLGDAGAASSYDQIPAAIEWSEHQRLAYEKESLGFYITGHPLAQYSSLLKLYATAATDSLAEKPDKSEVKIGGVVAAIREITTKKGDRMGFVTLEDLRGMADIVVFPELYQKSNQLLKSDQPCFIIGQVDVDEERAKVIAREILPLSEVTTKLTKTVHFKLSSAEAGGGRLQALKGVLARFKGGCKTFVHMTIPDKSETVMELPSDLRVTPSLQLVSAVEKIFGHNVTYFQS